MISYRYDGTFSGFLTVAAETCGRWSLISAMERTVPVQEGLFPLRETAVTNRTVAVTFLASIRRKASPRVCGIIYHAFLSEAAGVEMLLLRYLELALTVGRGVDDMLSDSRVAPVHRLATRVRHEAHRMKGFVRFMEATEGFFYARIEPDHDVLPLIVPHFAERLGDRHWVIHDVRRKKGGVYDPVRGRWIMAHIEQHAEPVGSDAEQACRRLWQRYFHRLGMKERSNLKLQQAKVPKKYRRFLPEFD